MPWKIIERETGEVVSDGIEDVEDARAERWEVWEDDNPREVDVDQQYAVAREGEMVTCCPHCEHYQTPNVEFGDLDVCGHCGNSYNQFAHMVDSGE